jgi:hypothetical protein
MTRLRARGLLFAWGLNGYLDHAENRTERFFIDSKGAQG